MTRMSNIAERYRARFAGTPHVYRASGRVNLIGEHTDYNDGFAMPAAIEFYCWVAVSTREDRKLSIYSEEFSAAADADLDSASHQPSKTWSDYPVGVALQLEQAGFRLRGANLLIESEVPMGAGLSSSAAIEVATALALADQSGWSPTACNWRSSVKKLKTNSSARVSGSWTNSFRCTDKKITH